MRRAWQAVALCVLVVPASTRAQRVVTVRADNDAFNFWQLPWERPDEEYTSGVRLTLELDGAAAWAKRLGWALGARRTGTARTAHSYALGQDIFTAVRPKGGPTPMRGGRPDAGVLGFTARSRVERATSTSEVGWTIGVTGKPSLAEPMQRLFHHLAPRMNRPITWGPQLPAEPVFAVAFDRWRRLNAGALEVQPHGGASLGTLLTEARGGLGLRVGRDLPHGRLLPRAVGPIGVELTSDAQLRAVARNAVLSGTFFRASPRVAVRPMVGDLTAGVRLRWRALEVSWLAHQTSAEHASRNLAHRWSTLELSWQPAR